MHPGASAASRRYPAAHFPAAGRALSGRTGRTIVVAGSDGERALVDEVVRGMNGHARAVAGDLDLADLGALIAEAPLLIANDSGPVHVAAAVGTARRGSLRDHEFAAHDV